MSITIRDALRDKRGIVEGLGISLIVMTLLIFVGASIANYALLSNGASTQAALSAEVSSRAEAYASALNADLVSHSAPSMTRECSTTTNVCTQIISATPSADGNTVILRIQADAASFVSQSSTQDVKLLASEVTHVTGTDAAGNNLWALADEGLRFKVWGLGASAPTEVSGDDTTGPAHENRWVSVDDRAGVDSTGALWVWGKNNIGQAGIGKTSTTPVKPQRIGGSFRHVITGDDRGYAIDSAGYLWVWGKNTSGQLGLGTTTNVLTPTKVPGMTTTRVMAVSIGKNNAAVLTFRGDVLVTGQAQAGYSDKSGSSWRQIAATDSYTAIAASPANGTLALVTDSGALIDNGAVVTGPAGVRFTTVSKGATASYALDTAGSLYAWGQSDTGALGLGATTTSSAATKVATSAKVISVQGSKSGAVAVTSSGTLLYAGTVHLPYQGAGSATSTTFKSLTAGTEFRQVTGSPTDEVLTVMDKDGNLLSAGGTTAGLWPMNWAGDANQLIRMPAPDGFASYTWK